jgi:hypothetical protein
MEAPGGTSPPASASSRFPCLARPIGGWRGAGTPASDAVASAAVAVGGAIIYLTGRFYRVDSALSVVIAVVVAAGALHLLRDVVRSLRTGTALELADN